MKDSSLYNLEASGDLGGWASNSRTTAARASAQAHSKGSGIALTVEIQSCMASSYSTVSHHPMWRSRSSSKAPSGSRSSSTCSLEASPRSRLSTAVQLRLAATYWDLEARELSANSRTCCRACSDSPESPRISPRGPKPLAMH